MRIKKALALLKTYLNNLKPAAKKLHYHAVHRPHANLRRQFGWYDRWHNWRFHKHFHWGTLGGYVVLVGFVVTTALQAVFALDTTFTWDFTTPGNYSIDNALEVDGTSIRHKAQNYTSDTNTMGLWHLDETGGSTAEDSSGNNNDGTISGGTFSTGNLNNGLTLGGADDSLLVNDSASLSLTGHNTLEAWIKPDAAISASSSSQRQSIIDKGDYQLYIDNETGKLAYEIANNTATTWSQAAGQQVNGSWSNGSPDAVNDILVVGEDIYAAIGDATDAGEAGVWKKSGDDDWTKIGGTGINSSWPEATFESAGTLTSDGTNIYVGLGASTGDAEVWRWNGTSWSKIGGDTLNSSWASNTFESVASLLWHDNKLYAGLGITNASNDGEVWQWNGTSWTQIGGNNTSSNWGAGYSLVSALITDGTSVYAGIGYAAGDGEVWRYSGSGTSWTQIGGDSVNSGWSNSIERVQSLTYFNGKLYAGLGYSGGDAEVWEFNGTNDWTQIGGDNIGGSNWSAAEMVSALGYDDEHLYAGLGDGNGDGEVWQWNGTSWTQIGGDGLNGSQSAIDETLTLTEGGTLYWGYKESAGHVYLSAWNGSTWDIVGGQYINKSWGFQNPGHVVEVMTVIGDKLYAGSSSSSAGQAQVWEFDGSTWAMIGGQGINSSWSANAYMGVYGLANYGGQLYAGIGHTGSAGAAEVWRWDGESWEQVGGDGLHSGWTGYHAVMSLITFKGKLYAGLGVGPQDPEIFEWDGEEWVQIAGNFINSSWRDERQVSSMGVYNDQLCAGLGGIGSHADFWCWNGTDDWTQIGGDGLNDSWGSGYDNVFTMTPWRDKLYVGLGLSNGESEVWEWDGDAWSLIGGDGINSSWEDATYESVRTLTTYNGELYAGLGNGTADAEVWRYNGSSWSKIGGDGVNTSWNGGQEDLRALSAYRGKLYAGMGGSAATAQVWAYGNNGYLESDVSSWDTDWHHVAATYDGTTMRLFIDGEASGSKAAAQTIPDTSKPLLIGTGHGSRELGKPQARFAGQLDEIRISNVVRSSFNTTPYSTAQLLVSPNDPQLSNGVEAWSAFANNASLNGASLEYRLSGDDGTTWKYWDGDSWSTSGGPDSANTVTEINDHIADFPVSLGGGIKWQAVIQGNGNQRLTLNSVTVTGVADTADPDSNASDIVMRKANGGAIVTSNGWTNGSGPHFAWTEASDSGSGIYGYCLYLGQIESSDPTSTKGLLGTSPLSTSGTDCQFIVSSNSVDLATDGYLDTALTSSSNPYYFYVTAVDAAGNSISNTDVGFQFRFDNTAPSNPDYASAPSSFQPTKQVTISWPAGGDDGPSDDHSGVSGLQYRIHSNGTWYGDSHTGTQDLSDLLSNDGSYTTINNPDFSSINDGSNTVYLRTWDAAGNVSSSTINTVIRVNTNAPSAVQNLIANPSANTTNSFEFSWDPPEAHVGTESSIDYCYTVNTLPTVSTCNFTGPGVTSLDAGAYATQPGDNTLYVIPKDEAGNINYNLHNEEDSRVTFTANTAAPGVPLNLDIADISVKQTSNWKLALSWETPTSVGAGVDSYKIFRSTNNDTYTEVAETSGASFVDSGLSAARYYYKVKACDSANNCGALTTEVSELPTGKFTTPPELITEPTASTTTRTATISWATDRASDSRLQYGLASGDYFPTEAASSERLQNHVIELANLQAGTTYYYRARWTDEDGNIGTSNEKTFTTAPAPMVKNVEIVRTNLNSALLRFTSEAAAKVKIYYGESEGFGGVETINTSISESTYNVELVGLDDGTSYFYKLNTMDADDNEYESGRIDTFNTPPRPRISNLRFQPIAGAPTSTQKVTWNTNVPSTSLVRYQQAGGTTLEVVSSKLTTRHEVVIKGLLDDSQYTLVAESRDADGNLAVSASETFKTALDTRPPKISDVLVETGIRGTGTEARGQLIISWTTDEPSTSQVAFGEGSGGDNYSSKSAEDSELTTDHIVIISDLPTSKVYHLQPISKDKSGNETVGVDQSTIIARASESVLTIILNSLQRIFGF